jgi:hypothetical protein
MPEPDIYATCPHDGNILDYYAGTFETVYVSLSPFIQPASISPDLFEPDTYPKRTRITEICKAVPWSTVMSIAGLPALSAVDIGLRTQILGLDKRHMNQEFAARIKAMTESTGIIPPCEGEHSDLLHNQVLELFQELGHEWVWVGDEFCTERKLHWIEDLKNEQEPTISGHCNVFSPDKSFLWTVHWDSHFSLLCSSLGNLNRIKVAERLEGFFCGPRTQIYWSVHAT